MSAYLEESMKDLMGYDPIRDYDGDYYWTTLELKHFLRKTLVILYLKKKSIHEILAIWSDKQRTEREGERTNMMQPTDMKK